MAFSGILAVISGGEKRIRGGGGVNRRLTADYQVEGIIKILKNLQGIR